MDLRVLARQKRGIANGHMVLVNATLDVTIMLRQYLAAEEPKEGFTDKMKEEGK